VMLTFHSMPRAVGVGSAAVASAGIQGCLPVIA
jgi:hypothetical protein